MEVEGIVDHVPAESGKVRLQILKIYRDDGKRASKEVAQLQVQCPIGLSPWKSQFALGDTLLLDYQVDTRPSRGWLWWGGKGGHALLKAPEKGVPVTCRCVGKPDPERFPLMVAFLRSDGTTSSQIELSGKSEPILLRVLPFWSGRRAKPDGIVRLRCAWDANGAGLPGN